MIQLNDTTYSIPGHGDRLIAPVITLGGKDAKKFVPNLNIGYDFGGGEEYYDNLNRTDKIITGKSEIKHDGKKVRLIEGSDIDEIYTDERGRVKWDVIFEKCPETFVLEWRRTCSDGLTAYYQDALTEEEIREGAHRPDDVIGSYAIYCDKAHNWIRPLNRKKEIPADWRTQRSAGAELGDLNISAYRDYKTGKVSHRYRPFVIDADGKTAWCTLLIIGNIERVTLPEDFMRSARYPVTLDPTLGYSTAGSSSYNYNTDFGCRGNLYNSHTAASGDEIISVSMYGRSNSSVYDATVEHAIYDISGGHLSGRLGEVFSQIISYNGGSSTWFSGSVSRSMSSGISYGVAIGFALGGNRIILHYDAMTSGSDVSSGPNLADPFVLSSTYNYVYSIYATYTESSGGHPTASRFRGMDRNNNVRYA